MPDDMIQSGGDEQNPQTESERQEYWGDILGRHPVSEEYKQAHEKATLIDWTPEGLIRAERYIEGVVEKAREALSEARRYDNQQARSVMELFGELNKIAESDSEANEVKELHKMMNDDNTTISQFVDWYRRHHLHNVEVYLEEAHTYAGILNDVRTGHAGTTFMKDVKEIPDNGIINATAPVSDLRP
jgi:hypothetical protein